ncbi:hypothetical protein M758_UG080800 [Ceratodon purpureus]|nr:hypothetical protein M758_UG080800 [Ceratodon purpureus]
MHLATETSAQGTHVTCKSGNIGSSHFEVELTPAATTRTHHRRKESQRLDTLSTHGIGAQAFRDITKRDQKLHQSFRITSEERRLSFFKKTSHSFPEQRRLSPCLPALCTPATTQCRTSNGSRWCCYSYRQHQNSSSPNTKKPPKAEGHAGCNPYLPAINTRHFNGNHGSRCYQSSHTSNSNLHQRTIAHRSNRRLCCNLPLSRKVLQTCAVVEHRVRRIMHVEGLCLPVDANAREQGNEHEYQRKPSFQKRNCLHSLPSFHDQKRQSEPAITRSRREVSLLPLAEIFVLNLKPQKSIAIEFLKNVHLNITLPTRLHLVSCLTHLNHKHKIPFLQTWLWNWEGLVFHRSISLLLLQLTPQGQERQTTYAHARSSRQVSCLPPFQIFISNTKTQQSTRTERFKNKHPHAALTHHTHQVHSFKNSNKKQRTILRQIYLWGWGRYVLSQEAHPAQA